MPPKKPFTPPDWQEATVKTIERGRAILALNPDLTPAEQRELFQLAYNMTVPMVTPGSATAYWSAWINVLRILVTMQTKTDLTTLFA